MPVIRAIVRESAPRLSVLVAHPRRRPEHAIPDADDGRTRPYRSNREERGALVAGSVFDQRSCPCSSPRMSLARRTFLRGMGATVALPLLESMVPAFTCRRGAGAPRRLHLHAARRGDGGVDAGDRRRGLRVHARAEAARTVPRFGGGARAASAGRSAAPTPTARRPGSPASRRRRPWRKTSAPARRSTRCWRRRSVRTRRSRRSNWRPRTSPATSAACDSGYSCTYLNTMSWRSPTSPLPMEINPRVVFERLFGRAGTPRPACRRGCGKTAASSTRSGIRPRVWRRKLSARDRTRLGEYLEHVAKSSAASRRPRSR